MGQPGNKPLEYQSPVSPVKRTPERSAVALLSGLLGFLALFFPVVAMAFASNSDAMFNLAVGIELALGSLTVICAIAGIVKVASSNGLLSGIDRCIFGLITTGMVTFYWCWSHRHAGGMFPWFK